MANSFFSTIAAGVVLSLAVAPEPAFAADFTPEGQQHWVAVAQALLKASSADPAEMAAPCRGVSVMGGGGEIRKESSQVPKWAVMAHFRTCLAFKTVATGGKGFMHTNAGDVCKGLKAAVGDLEKAKAGVDPDDVVAVAGQLSTALASLAGEFKAAKACRIG